MTSIPDMPTSALRAFLIERGVIRPAGAPQLTPSTTPAGVVVLRLDDRGRRAAELAIKHGPTYHSTEEANRQFLFGGGR